MNFKKNNLAMKFEEVIKRLDELSDSLFDSYFEKLEREENILNYQIDKWRDKILDKKFIDPVIKKIIQKYDSDEYVNKEYKKGFIPREGLFWFLYNFTKKYGDKATDEEFEKHSSMFTSEIYFLHNWIIERIDGQGSSILIKKI